LVRLTISDLAENKAANNISVINPLEIDTIISKISKRVSKVSPKLQSDVVKELQQFVDDWKMLQKISTNKLYYFVAETTKYNRLMNYYGEICSTMEKPTLNSMREVETESTLFYYEVK
jgi:GTP1/Obg family GTP-binding protein